MRQIEGLGKVSCSRLSAVMGSPVAWISYRAEIRKEWELLGDPARLEAAQATERTTRAMRHGRETEDRALAEFEIRHPEAARGSRGRVLFHPRFRWLCGTPDLTFPASGVEVKCPVNEARHVLQGQPIPREHWPQLQGYMAITGVPYWWFVSYFIMHAASGLASYTENRVQRDETYIARMLKRAEAFWRYVCDDDEASVYDYYPKSPGFEDLGRLFRESRA